MIEIVIKYDEQKNEYLVYEPTTNTIMVSSNLTEALLGLNNFLITSGLTNVDILQCNDISYHIDSKTMRSIVEGNMALLKRINTAPSGFQISSQRFGSSIDNSNKNNYKTKNKQKQKSNSFSSAKGFSDAYKKFGGK
jgi:hypothetical protein